jgi:ubiquinone/menaquinone biosynthesis C-methylase UbiE
MSLDRLRKDWEAFGAADPLWAVYSDRKVKGSKWDPAEFFATGVEEIRSLMSFLGAQPLTIVPGRALDFGCGVGRLTQPLADHFGSVCGVDIAASMLEVARTYNTKPDRCEFMLNQKPDLSLFAPDSFDFIYSNIVFQHMSPELTRRYLQEFFRVLKPGAVAVFTLPSTPRRTIKGWFYRWVPSAMIHVYKRVRDGYGATMEMHAIDRRVVEPFLQATGFAIADVSSSASAGPNWDGYRYCVRKPEP